MEIIVILIALSSFLSLIGFFTKKKGVSEIFKIYLPFFSLLLIITNFIIGRHSWQIIPLYILVLTLILISIAKIKQNNKTYRPTISRKRKIIKIILVSLGILYLVIAVLTFIFFPIVNLPSPTGEYIVGTTYLHFVDSNRLEILTDDPNDYREFNVRVWYPADSTQSKKPLSYKETYSTTGYIDPATLPPSFIFGHYNLVKTNSYLDVQVSNKLDSYPVIVFSPGFLSDYTDYQLHLEELASQGYIVLAPDTPYEFQSVSKPDGSFVPFTKAHAEDYKKESESTLPLWKEFWSTNKDDERERIAKEILSKAIFMNKVLDTRVKDIQFMVVELEKMKEDELLYGKLDMDHMGIFGHSMGGAVAGQVCLVDDRFKSGINLDGFQFGDVINGTIKQPFMMVYSEPFAYVNNYILNNFNNTLYQLVIKGSTHMNFDDNMFVMPITKQMGMVGKIDKNKMREINNGYIVSFFNKYLKNKENPLLEQIPSRYPEVDFKSN